MFNRRQSIGDNFRRDIPEAQEFLYPDDSQRISKKDAAKAAGYIGAAAGEGFIRAGIPIPVRALIGQWGKTGLDRIKAVANRPDATPSMHQAYLDDKYGATGWDVYRDRNDLERRNPEFYYNEQDFGNDAYFTQRENKRFAGEALSDEWLEDIKAHGIEQDMLDEYVEQRKQLGIAEAIHGKSETAAFLDTNNPSRTAEQQIARNLVMNGIMPDIMPPDRILGKDVSIDIKDLQPGINKSYQDNSEIRRDVTGGLNNNDILKLKRGDIRTEILSPKGIDDIYEAWKAQREIGWAARRNQTSKSNFNNLVAEYYGQQGLKLRDNLPASLKMTDDNGIVGGANSEQGDFQFKDNSGKTRVIDNQQREVRSGQGNSLNLNLVRQSKLRNYDKQSLINDIYREAAYLKTNNINDILASIAKRQGLVITDDYGVAKESGLRPGKHLGDRGLGKEAYVNVPRNQIQGVLYNIVDDMSSKTGMLPKNLIQLDNDQVSQTIGNMIKARKLDVSNLNISDAGGISIEVPNTFTGLAESDPTRMAQLSEPYMLNKAIPKVIPQVAPKRAKQPVQSIGANLNDGWVDLTMMTPQERSDWKQAELRKPYAERDPRLKYKVPIPKVQPEIKSVVIDDSWDTKDWNSTR